MTHRTSRRALLKLFGVGGAGMLLAACAAPPPTPTTAPKPAEAPKPAAPAPTTAPAAAAPAPTTAPAAAATKPAAAAPAPTTADAPKPSAPTAAAAKPAAAVPGADADGKIPSPGGGVPDAFVKLPKPFKSVSGVPGRGGKVTSFHILYQTPITPRGENRFWAELEKRLNIQLEATFASGNGGYQEKLPAIVASGDIPDLTFAWIDTPGAPSVNQAFAQGAFADLTPHLSGENLKAYPNLALFPQDIWQRSAFNKKIVGVPRPRLRAIGGLTFRDDWGKKFGNPRPKTTDEFLKLMQDFTKGDPDGNGQADTWGLGNQNTALFALNWSNFMHAVPNQWRKSADGALTHMFETEEYKNCVAFCRRMWEAGVYHPELLTMTVTKVNELFDAGKIGAYWQGIEGVPGRRVGAKKLNPAAEVTGMTPPPAAPSVKPVVWSYQGFYGHTSIPAKVARDGERVKELLRVLDYFAAPFGSEEWVFLNYGVEGVHHTAGPNGLVRTDAGRNEIGELTNLTYCLPPFFYDDPQMAVDMQNIQKEYLPYLLENPTLGFYSPTQVAKAGELAQLTNDRQTAVITGREPMSALDQFVKDWRARGGDQMRKELELALKA